MKDGIKVSIVTPGIIDPDFGVNTPSPEPGALRRAADGALVPLVIAPTAVAAAIRSGDPEVELVHS